MNCSVHLASNSSASQCKLRTTVQRYTLIATTAMAISTSGAHADQAQPGAQQGDAAVSSEFEGVYTLPALNVIGDSLVTEHNGAVLGYVAEVSRVGTKTDTSILETPQSISVVTRQQMDLQRPTSTSAALRYTAGATSEKFGGFGDYIDLTRIRGVDADYYLDGLRIISNAGSWLPQIDPYTLERVEVLRGPSASLYGQGTGGGIVNQVSRKPQAEVSHELNIQYGSFERKHIGFDTTGPMNEDQTLLYRFTASGLDSNGQVEDVQHERLYLAPSLTWLPDEHTSWTLMATHSREPDLPNYNSLPAAVLGLNNSPYPQIKRRRNFTDMNFEGSSRRQNSLSSLFEHELANGWTFTSNTRYMYIDSDLQRGIVYGYQAVDGRPQLKGTYEQTSAKVNTLSLDNNLRGDIELGPTTHTVLAGIDYSKGTVKNDLYSVGPVLFDPYGSNYRPNITPDFTASRAAPWRVKQALTREGVYLQDQIAYDHWRLTLSARHDWSKTDDQTNSYSATSRTTRQYDKKWSGRAGLSYQFDAGIAPYVSYSTSFDPLLGTDYKGDTFIPVESKQSEVGIKYHPQNSKTLMSAAVFQLNQTNVKTSDADHLGFSNQAGEVRIRGLDLQATSEIAENTNLIASYTYLDNVLIKDSRYQGKQLVQTPEHSAAVWLDYLIGSGPLAGLQLGSGVRYLGETYGDPSNTFKVPDATLVDVALNYDLGHLISEWKGSAVALNVSNLANKQYVASCSSQMYCFIGQDRTVTATLNYRW